MRISYPKYFYITSSPVYWKNGYKAPPHFIWMYRVWPQVLCPTSIENTLPDAWWQKDISVPRLRENIQDGILLQVPPHEWHWHQQVWMWHMWEKVQQWELCGHPLQNSFQWKVLWMQKVWESVHPAWQLQKSCYGSPTNLHMQGMRENFHWQDHSNITWASTCFTEALWMFELWQKVCPCF